ncbi:MAG: bifunctional glutamate N-acetyltransferase/amino-acid acetyltransferase ArgJ [Lentisphaerae bacterium]|nr:bifunctional glutamate N-acetyltransferase/amino-acid acetyltransferase ArgJ [Lentisphaerota bacterium]
MNFEFVDNGSITTPSGFLASGVTAGFKRSGAPDFAMVVSEVPADFAGVFTSCTFAAAPVRVCRKRVKESDFLQAVIINSGNANACTGEQGLAASEKSCQIAADSLNIAPENVAVASTGRIGVQMNMELIERGVALARKALTGDGGNTAAQAIMTTDTVPKAAAVKVEVNGKTFNIGAITKGAGMIDPHLTTPHATMICIITTDAKISKPQLQKILQRNANDSFNRITIDGDMSTNDTVLILANGTSGTVIEPDTTEEDAFAQALLALMQNLAKRMVLDGEGASKFVEVKVINARTENDAKLAAEAVGNSLLCKTAWFGNDPNWGRVVAALGYSGAQFAAEKCDIFFGDIPVVKNGGDAGTPEEALLETVKQREFSITCDFHDGDAEYWVWASDLSYEYVKINADYHT